MFGLYQRSNYLNKRYFNDFRFDVPGKFVWIRLERLKRRIMLLNLFIISVTRNNKIKGELPIINILLMTTVDSSNNKLLYFEFRKLNYFHFNSCNRKMFLKQTRQLITNGGKNIHLASIPRGI